MVVVVRRFLVGARRALCVVALNRNLAKSRKVVAVILDVAAIPVNHATSPIDGALGVGLETTRPEGNLDTRRSLGKVPLVRSGVPSLGLLLGSCNHAIDHPIDLFGRPADLVLVEVIEGIR